MTITEQYTLHGICLRLIHGLDIARPEAMALVCWMRGRQDVFGPLPPVIGSARRGPVLDARGWNLLAAHLANRLAAMPEPVDTALDRLRAIAAHLGLTIEEESILGFLAILQRRGPLSDFAAMLQREIGLSTESVIALCCNLDEAEVWSVLAPQARLVSLGLVQSDSMLVVLRDDPYVLSGLLVALLSPPSQRRTILGSGRGTKD
jgi:hypothetical protein